MSDTDMARSHVERCLQDEWGICDLRPDADGHYPYCSGTAACWIAVHPGDPPVVTAVACAAVGVKKSMKLFRELNETERPQSHDSRLLGRGRRLGRTGDARPHTARSRPWKKTSEIGSRTGTTQPFTWIQTADEILYASTHIFNEFQAQDASEGRLQPGSSASGGVSR